MTGDVHLDKARMNQLAQDVIEIEVTPEMIEAGREAFDKWMLRWDYLGDGMPGDIYVSELLSSIFSRMAGVQRPMERDQFLLNADSKYEEHRISPNGAAT